MSLLLLSALLAILVGLTLGLLGGGGSILTLPILVYLLKVDTTPAIAISLFVVATTSAVATVQHARAKNVDFRTGLIFSAAGMVGAVAGGQIAPLLSDRFLLLLFAAIMLTTAVAMLRKKPATDEAEEVVTNDRPLPVAKILIEGVIVGAITGMVGAGGGFLVVPALALLGGLSMQRAIGTSLLVITAKSYAGFASLMATTSIDWALTLTFTAAAIAGTLPGVYLAKKIPAAGLRKGFAIFVLLMAVFIGLQETGLLFNGLRD